MTDIITLLENFFYADSPLTLLALLVVLILMMGFAIRFRYSTPFSMIICFVLIAEYIERMNPEGQFAWHVIILSFFMIFLVLRFAGLIGGR